MRKFLSISMVLALGAAMVGCGSSSDSTTEGPPKGPPAQTQTAPPGTPGPQERTGAGGGEADK